MAVAPLVLKALGVRVNLLPHSAPLSGQTNVKSGRCARETRGLKALALRLLRSWSMATPFILLGSTLMTAGCLDLVPATYRDPAPGYPVAINDARVRPGLGFEPIQVQYGTGCASTEFEVLEIRDEDAPEKLFYRFDFFLDEGISVLLVEREMRARSDDPAAFDVDPPCVSLGEATSAPTSCDKPDNLFNAQFRTFGRGPHRIDFRVSDLPFPPGTDPTSENDEASYDLTYWTVELDTDAECTQ